MGYKWNPLTGTLDYFEDVSNVSTTKLTVTRIADEEISLGDCVFSVANGRAGIAQPNLDLARATVLGIATNNAAVGESVEILRLGILSDPIFSVFTNNAQLFLDVDGAITDVRRNTGYLTLIAKCLGNNEIFVSVNDPITLGAV